jgi:hypothetical protein
VKTTNVKISYDWRDADPLIRLICREMEAHDWPEGGQEGREKQGAYVCKRCRVVKRVKESLQ